MYLIDYHTHSELSPDSSAPLIADAKAAVAMGISELCTTDHFDLLTGDGARDYPHHLDWAARVAQHHAVKSAMGDTLTLKLGIEYGSGQVDAADSAKILALPELDFVIGSLHNTSLAVDGRDFYYLKYTSSPQCYAMLDDYFNSMEALVAADCYDVLGHIIFLKRYMTARDGQTVSFDGYMDRLRGILTSAVAHGKGMELNTWCGRTLEEWRPTLAVFKSVGGEHITVGSDAHSPDLIGHGIREAYDLLREVGFRYVTTYEKRKPIQVKL